MKKYISASFGEVLKLVTGILLSLSSMVVQADGVVVDKVYHPYVTANEKEFEWRLLSSETDEANRLAQRLGYGQSILENLALDFYLIAERDDYKDFTLQAVEVEARWMMTEQGQYWADWGLLFEVEAAERNDNKSFEITSGLIFEKEFGKKSLTMNLFLIQEWGDVIPTEMETEFRLKYRYRYLPGFQPAIELYTGEDFLGIGPAMMGVHRFNGQKQLKWEVGFITEIAHSGKDHSLRFALEYEF